MRVTTKAEEMKSYIDNQLPPSVENSVYVPL